MAEVKIQADSGGGSVALKGPASTTDDAAVSLKLPVADGSANQLLKTDGSGNLGWATDQGGKILQVKSGTQKNKQSTTADSTGSAGEICDWGDLITGLSLTLTPASVNSKILIMYDVAITGPRYAAIGIGRTPAGGTKVLTAAGDQDGTNTHRVAKGSPHNNQGGTYPEYENAPTCAGTFLDDPFGGSGSVVALTYGVYFGHMQPSSGSVTTWVNRGTNAATTDDDWVGLPTSTLTIMEIGA